MYSQTFTAENLYRLTRQSERRDFAPDAESKQSFCDNLRQICDYINLNDSFDFKFREVDDVYVNGYDKASLDALVQDLIIRKIYENIKRIYKIKQANRNRIIKQLVVLLTDTYPSFIIRLDIKKFYESICREKIVSKLIDDIRLNHISVALIQSIFKDPSISSISGLPRGLSLSSILSELYMKKIDNDIRHLEGVYYYERFVDDIIIFCNDIENFKKIQAKASEILYSHGLKINYNKRLYLQDSDFYKGKLITYLGYSIKASKPEKRDRTSNVLDIEFAPAKMKSFKTKITKAFIHFAKGGEYFLLKQRIKFLSGNYWVSNPTDLRPIKAGVYYNYSLLKGSGKQQLSDLDKYYHHILHCKKGKLGAILCSKLNDVQIAELEDYSFIAGWEKKMTSYFTPAQIGIIKSCWI